MNKRNRDTDSKNSENETEKAIKCETQVTIPDKFGLAIFTK